MILGRSEICRGILEERIPKEGTTVCKRENRSQTISIVGILLRPPYSRAKFLNVSHRMCSLLSVSYRCYVTTMCWRPSVALTSRDNRKTVFAKASGSKPIDVSTEREDFLVSNSRLTFTRVRGTNARRTKRGGSDFLSGY